MHIQQVLGAGHGPASEHFPIGIGAPLVVVVCGPLHARGTLAPHAAHLFPAPQAHPAAARGYESLLVLLVATAVFSLSHAPLNHEAGREYTEGDGCVDQYNRSKLTSKLESQATG